MSIGQRDQNINIPGRGKRNDVSKNVNVLNGTYVGVVTNTEDANNTGRIKVRLSEYGSLESSPSEHIVLLMTPMGGSSGQKETSEDTDSEDETAKSFGMWPQPPAVNTTVVVQFLPSMQQGILMGSLITGHSNHNMGGNASAENKDGEISPVAEQNPHDTGDTQTKPVAQERTAQLEDQGLEEDYSRGHSMSSARRESPSKVFGITTAGGAGLTMDDGTAEGDSKTIRLRSPAGAQFLIDDTNDFMYITNQKGTAWIEINGEGQIDIYAKGSISMHSEDDINFHSGGDINLNSEQKINMFSGDDTRIESLGKTNITSKHHKETANRIDMNSGGQVAQVPDKNPLVENKGVTKSVASRVPEKQPWGGAVKVQETFTTAEGRQK
jgi:hypothetical protein